MKEKFTILRYIVYSVEILILFVLQGVPFLIPEICGSKPVLLISLALIIASREKEIPAMVFGFVCGIMCDLGICDTVGYFTIALTSLCYVLALILKSVMVKNFINTMLISFCAVAIAISVYFLLFYVCKGYSDPWYYFINHYLSRIVYTFVCCIPLYFINKFIYFELKEKNGF